MSSKAPDKDQELSFFGKETMNIFNELAMEDTPTDRERVVKIANSIRNIIKRIEGTEHPCNFITLLMLEECYSELHSWYIKLRTTERLAKDEQEEGKQYE